MNLAAVFFALSSFLALAGGNSHYAPRVQGAVAGFRLAGIEPDGDPLDQVVLETTLLPSAGAPRLHLIVDAYLENFQPDTTPILPDLLHNTQTAQNLGGFLSGKALITDGTGNVLYLGSFLAEAFLNNTNEAVMRLYGNGAAYGSSGALKGTFNLNKHGALTGTFFGRLRISGAARRQLAANQAGPMRALKDIIKTVSVQPHPMVGRATKGSSGVVLHTGFGSSASSQRTGFGVPGQPQRGPSMVTILAGIGAILSFLAGIILYVRERRAAPAAVTTSPEATTNDEPAP
jgi:hypothetical protein